MGRNTSASWNSCSNKNDKILHIRYESGMQDFYLLKLSSCIVDAFMQDECLTQNACAHKFCPYANGC